MSLYGAMCWVGGWDFVGMAVAAWWHVIRVRCTCVSGSNNLQQVFLVLLFISFSSTSSPGFYTELELFGSAGFRGTYVFGPARFGQCIDWWYSFLLTEIWWYSCHWSLWTVWLVEPSSESFVSRSAGSEKF